MIKLEPLTGRHERKAFDCGVAPLNTWLTQTALQHQSKGISNFINKRYPLLKESIKKPTFRLAFYIHIVELEGVEPSSKQAAKVLSTCLAFSWFSGWSRQKATLLHPYSLWF